MGKRRSDLPWSRPDYPALWRTTFLFIRAAHRVQLGKSKSARHFTGGPARHQGAKCAKCKRALALLWDLDLGDPLFDELIRTKFSPATRLPLYFCWQCFGVSYGVSSDEAIKVYSGDRQLDLLEDFESPFDKFPKERPRRPLKVQKIPSIESALLLMEQDLSLESLDAEARERLSTYIGRPIKFSPDINLSQLGGMPKHIQGRQLSGCPDSKCPASGELTPVFAKMKELAVVSRDVDEELKEIYFTLHYTVCPICVSIRAQYECS